MNPKLFKINNVDDLGLLKKEVSNIISKKCWDVEIRQGDELILNIGGKIKKPIPNFPNHITGEWVLGTRGTGWILTDDKNTVVSSDSDFELINEKISIIKGMNINNIEINYPDLNLIIEFESKYKFSIEKKPEDDDYDIAYWELFTPNDIAIVVGPGTKWKYSYPPYND